MNPPKYLHVGLFISAGKTLDGSFFEGLRASRHRGWSRVTEPQGSRQDHYRFRHQTTSRRLWIEVVILLRHGCGERRQ
ncbi:MAG: hypothetical protein GY774_05995 [Planctomycetes bacterium]|nr:hypothetical protein [Planctomycetota bacterium]